MKKLISEDQKIYDVQRQMMGMKNQTDPQANNVSTLVGANNTNTNAPVNRPYPLNYHDDILANIFLDMLNYKKMLANADANPALKEEYKQIVYEIDKKINVICEIIVEIDKYMSKIV